MERMMKVLQQEVDNTNQMILYQEGDSWYAYEHSAYLLASKQSVIVKKEIWADGYDVVLVKAKIEDPLSPLGAGFTLKWAADDTLQFAIDEQLTGFPEWKENQLKKFSA